jgi:hypothetical protein
MACRPINNNFSEDIQYPAVRRTLCVENKSEDVEKLHHYTDPNNNTYVFKKIHSGYFMRYPRTTKKHLQNRNEKLKKERKSGCVD